MVVAKFKWRKGGGTRDACREVVSGTLTEKGWEPLVYGFLLTLSTVSATTTTGLRSTCASARTWISSKLS